MEEILRILPHHIKSEISSLMKNRWHALEEIRLRINREVELSFHDSVEWLVGVSFTEMDSTYVLNQLSEHSLYRLTDELREGYITIQGGHRVGLAGEVTTNQGKIQHIQYVTFFNIRLAREVKDLFRPYIHHLYDSQSYVNTLIIGAPQTGKTTLIRDIARLMSDGDRRVGTKKVVIIDERSEIAASTNGIPQHNIGKRTDVLDACPKVEGMMMMIRSMSPEVLIVDEIGKAEDVQALMEAINAGVTVVCTIHGKSIKELKKRPMLKQLFENHVFSRLVILKKTPRKGFELTLLNENERELISGVIQ